MTQVVHAYTLSDLARLPVIPQEYGLKFINQVTMLNYGSPDEAIWCLKLQDVPDDRPSGALELRFPGATTLYLMFHDAREGKSGWVPIEPDGHLSGYFYSLNIWIGSMIHLIGPPRIWKKETLEWPEDRLKLGHPYSEGRFLWYGRPAIARVYVQDDGDDVTVGFNHQEVIQYLSFRGDDLRLEQTITEMPDLPPSSYGGWSRPSSGGPGTG